LPNVSLPAFLSDARIRQAGTRATVNTGNPQLDQIKQRLIKPALVERRVQLSDNQFSVPPASFADLLFGCPLRRAMLLLAGKNAVWFPSGSARKRR
jgi:hypothetical protein